MADRKTYGQWSFNGGEVSPRIQTRIDLNVHGISLGTMLGWLPLLQGPALAAPGTIYAEAAAGPCRLLPFEYNPTQGYVIEASNLKFRFYTNDARIETAPGVAYEVAHPYSAANLADLDYQQSADVLYIVGAGKKPQTLSRTGATTFVLADFAMRNGPIDLGNSDEGITVTVSAPSGAAIAIVASSAIFAAGDVGGLFEIEANDFNDIPSWEPGITVGVGDKRTWAGKVYQCAGGTGRTGTVAPEHDIGTEWDGMGSGTDINAKGPFGVQWTFLHGRFGLARITAYVSPTQVTATVLNRFADSVVTTATWTWAFGAFSDRRGWPDTVTLWNDCLVLTKGNRVFTSVIGDFDNFESRDSSGDFQRDLSGQVTLPAPHKVVWTAADRFLLLGSETGEFTMERVQIQTGTPGPPVFEVRLQSSYGSRRTKPVQADGRMLFLQRAGRKLREMGYAISADRYVAPDMTRLADHLGVSGFVELAWQAEPERLVWAVLGDGTLAAMTYDPSQEVMGWARRQLGGGLKATSACRITDPEGKRDQIWIAVDAGGGAFWVLRMAKAWESGDAQTSPIMSDAALSYDGPPVKTFAGLGHLEGKTVDILADGKPHRQLVVVGGSVTLDFAASLVHIGLPFPAWFETLSPEVGQSEGTAQGKLKRISALDVHMVETQGIRISVQGCDLIPVETRTNEDPMDQAVPLFTGSYPIPTIGTYERLGKVRIERFQPTPATIVALVPAIEVGDV